MKSRARLLVHQQVEVAPAVALLDVGQAVERVRQRRVDLRRAARAGRRRARARRAATCVGVPIAPTMSPRCDVDRRRCGSPGRAAGCGRSGRRGRGRRASPSRAARARGRRARRSSAPSSPGSSALGLGADGRDLVAVGKPLRRHRRESRGRSPRTSQPGRRSRPGATAAGAVSPSTHPRSRAARVERRGSASAFVSSAHGSAGALGGLEPGREQRAADALGAARPASTPIPARYQCGPGTARRRAGCRPRGRRQEARRRLAPSSQRRRDRRARSAGADVAPRARGPAAASARSAARSAPAVVQSSASISSKPSSEEPRQRPRAGARRPGSTQVHAGSSWNARASTAAASASCSRRSRTISTAPSRRRRRSRAASRLGVRRP